MSDFYTDAHIARALVDELQRLGHTVIRCQDVGLNDASDSDHLLYAATHGLVLVSSDNDFEVLNEAWNTWPVRWGIATEHGGILRIPTSNILSTPLLPALIDAFVLSQGALQNRLFRLGADANWH